MAKIRVPTVLRPLASGEAVIEIEATDLSALRGELGRHYPALAERLYDSSGAWRDFVSVFVDGEDARYLDRAAPITKATEVQLLPAISGG